MAVDEGRACICMSSHLRGRLRSFNFLSSALSRLRLALSTAGLVAPGQLLASLLLYSSAGSSHPPPSLVLAPLVLVALSSSSDHASLAPSRFHPRSRPRECPRRPPVPASCVSHLRLCGRSRRVSHRHVTDAAERAPGHSRIGAFRFAWPLLDTFPSARTREEAARRHVPVPRQLLDGCDLAGRRATRAMSKSGHAPACQGSTLTDSCIAAPQPSTPSTTSRRRSTTSTTRTPRRSTPTDPTTRASCTTSPRCTSVSTVSRRSRLATTSTSSLRRTARLTVAGPASSPSRELSAAPCRFLCRR